VTPPLIVKSRLSDNYFNQNYQVPQCWQKSFETSRPRIECESIMNAMIKEAARHRSKVQPLPPVGFPCFTNELTYEPLRGLREGTS